MAKPVKFREQKYRSWAGLARTLALIWSGMERLFIDSALDCTVWRGMGDSAGMC